MNDPVILIAAFVIGYLLGTIPFGVIVTRLAGMEDIRTVGSGNIGATNVLRTGHKGLAVVTLIGDALKGAAAVLLARYFFGETAALVAGLGAFIGHIFPVWLKFKGGKGVATYVGILAALAWPIAVAFAVVWIVVAAASRYSSLAALIASASMPPLLWERTNHSVGLLFAVLTVLLWIMHRTNIARLLAGTEGKIARSKPNS